MPGSDKASVPAGDAPVTELSAPLLRRALTAAADWLAHNASAIDAINVFPVPDGDTGSNMALTLRTAVAELQAEHPDAPVPQLLTAAARGALLGARGNSGVILSQWLRGFAEALTMESISTADLDEALARAAEAARAAIVEPREGTILSVSDALAGGARTGAIVPWGEAIVQQAQQAVDRTPEQLPMLREAGVVDAGALGLATALEGFLYGLRDETLPQPPNNLGSIDPEWLADAGAGLAEASGFCTEFIVAGTTLDEGALRESMERFGDSVLVVGDRQMAHVHLHTTDPESAIAAGANFGQVSQSKADDLAALHSALQPTAGLAELAIVAIASGPGYIDQFRSLGVSLIVPGGQSMNPSAAAILRAAQTTHAHHVLVLPNNANIVPAARQAAQLAGPTDPRLHVVQTHSQPAGIAALATLTSGASAEDAAATMSDAAAGLLTGAVTHAARAIEEPLSLAKGQPFALMESEIVVAADSVESALCQLVAKMIVRAPAVSLLTLYQGDGVSPSAAEAVVAQIAESIPDAVEIELVIAGQHHYPWEVSLE